MAEKGRFRVRELVVVEILKILPVVPVEMFWLSRILLMVRLEEARFLLASVMTREEAVRVARLTLPSGVTLKNEPPLVEATAKMGKVWAEVEATTYREAPAGVEVLINKDLALLSQRKLAVPLVVVAAE